MARYQRATSILAAAEQWRDQCLLRDGSVFTDRFLWTLDNFKTLDRYFVQNLDYGAGTFFPKLKGQLAPAPAAAKQVAAELFWVMYLVVSRSAQSGASKRLQIRQVWSWSGEALVESHPLLGEILEEGVAHPGTAYHTHRWRELVFFITAMQDWKAQDRSERERLLSDPWVFARWLEQREHARGRQLRHVLLFLLFPDHFERTLTGSHKVAIAKAFAAEDAAVVDYSDRLAVDRAILQVRERLERHAGSAEVDFYQHPWRSTWLPEKGPVEPDGLGDHHPEEETPGVDDADAAAAWFEQRFGNVGVWTLSPGEGARLWPGFLRDGVAAIGWDALGDLSEYDSHDSLRSALIAATGQTNPINDSLAVYEFSHAMNVGDIIIAKKGRSRLLGWGRVEGDYRFDPSRSEFQHVRSVTWHSVNPVDVPKGRRIAVKTLTDFSRYKSWVRLAFGLMERLEEPPPASPAVHDDGDNYGIERALEDLFITRPAFSQILDAFSSRKNLILQGPPGVGKTFVAKRIAKALMGRDDPSRLEMVQFHQSYAYEDFVQGWRPTESGGFTLRHGVFFEFCRRAERSPDKPFVFIIDEINRGNLSRIFGELLMLIEADKRGAEFAMPLTYSLTGERFSVPENVHLLGLMNTADRSLAIVDYALRRRFAFVALGPAFGTEEFQGYLLRVGVEPDVVQLIDDRLAALNDRIRADSTNLGAGFEIGHSYFVPSGDEQALDRSWYRGIVESQIAPLLREYWFDQPAQVDACIGDLLA